MVFDGLTKTMKCPQLREMMTKGTLSVDMDKTKSKKVAKNPEVSPKEFWSV